MKIYILDLVWSQDHFINLKFNRSLFYDVSRECSLEGKFEAVINRTHPAYLLKLEGKDKTFLSHQVIISSSFCGYWQNLLMMVLSMDYRHLIVWSKWELNGTQTDLERVNGSMGELLLILSVARVTLKFYICRRWQPYQYHQDKYDDNNDLSGWK